jgi:sterol desaturase/sphingolipid hydroxylase (fatty acid hydroxylase superfamily)
VFKVPDMTLQSLFATRFELYDEDKIIHDQVPIRMFKSDILERLTHVHPVTVLALFMPVVLIALFRGAQLVDSPTGWLWLLVMFAAGICLWTLVEYLVHRFLFHYQPTTVWGKRLLFLFHGVHHVQPHVKTRLVMPPVISVPSGLLFFALFRNVFGLINADALMWPMFAGFTLGYIAYDMLHYAEHHLPMKGAVLRYLKRHHMEHHYKTPQARFGVTTSAWDTVMHTEPPRTDRPLSRP